MNRRELFSRLLGHATAVAGGGFCLGCVSSARSHSGSLFSPGNVSPAAARSGSSPSGEPAIMLPDRLHDIPEGIRTASLPSEAQKLALPPPGGRVRNTRPLSEFERYKLKYFDQNHPGDVYIDSRKRPMLNSCYQKLSLIKKYVGYGNFNLLSFDEMLEYSKSMPGDRQFTKEELDYFEEIFYFNAENYGFYGEKINKTITDTIPVNSVVKIPGSGHYLHRTASVPIYRQIIKDIGSSLILTSGIRSVVKQMHLFLGKTISVNGNFSQASRSLAPPGHSYHAVGDFDVGKKGLGISNFTSRFSETDEYKKLIDLGYIDIRYPSDNPFGVRFEPWHIEGKGRIS